MLQLNECFDLLWPTLLMQLLLATSMQVVFNYEAIFYHFSTDLTPALHRMGGLLRQVVKLKLLSAESLPH